MNFSITNLCRKNRQIMLGGVLLLIGLLVSVSTEQVQLRGNHLHQTKQLVKEDLQYPPQCSAIGTIERCIRIAILNEPNTTQPAYKTTFAGAYSNKPEVIYQMLHNRFDSIDFITTQDIYDQKLKTVNYDVLIILDNLPKENVTWLIKDFWHGGGGLIVNDGSLEFLCQFGLIPEESFGDDGFSTTNGYWSYTTTGFEISQHHPITEGLAIGTVIPTKSDYANWNFTKLEETRLSDDFIKIAETTSDNKRASILAYDPSEIGGKIVTFGYSFNDLDYSLNSILVSLMQNAVEWVSPTPKGRILFDLSHEPYYSVDIYDTEGVHQNRFKITRNNLVERDYTVDKWHPRADYNITPDFLNKYNLLILNAHGINYSLSERTMIESWVFDGGSLCVIGDHDDYASRSGFFNTTLNFMGWELKDNITDEEVITFDEYHPINEGVSDIDTILPIEISGVDPENVFWGHTTANCLAALGNYGNGKVFAIADLVPFHDNWLPFEDNERFAVNTLAYLAMPDPNVLVFSEDNVNNYQSELIDALGRLQLNYQFHKTQAFFNASLVSQSWDLVVVDNCGYDYNIYNETLEFIQSGGNLIFNTFNGYNSNLDDLLSYIGADCTDYSTSPERVYSWNNAHDICAYPLNWTNPHIDSLEMGFGIDYNYYEIFSNATALAGATTEPEDGNASIILGGPEDQCILIGPLLAAYESDSDDDGYQDSYEIWLNCLAFYATQLESPSIITPSQDLLTDSVSITWTEVPFATGYSIFVNGTLNKTVNGITTTITFGSNNEYEIYVIATGNRPDSLASNIITINVAGFEEETSTDTTTDTTTEDDDDTNGKITAGDFFSQLIDNWPVAAVGGGLGLLLGGLLFGVLLKKKKKNQ